MSAEWITANEHEIASSDSSAFGRFLHSTALDHQERYRFAGMVIKDASPAVIIDAASGSGWGTAHLADVTKAVQVVGLDIDKVALAEAHANFIAPNLSFKLADLSANGGIDGVPPADWIVSFETLEHIPDAHIPDFLYNLRQTATMGGRMILSTPNRELFSPYHDREGKPSHKFHTKEFSMEELLDTLNGNGWQVAKLFGQRFVYRSVYLGLATLSYPIRYMGLRMELPSASGLPIKALNRVTAATTSGEVRETDLGGARNAIYLTAICEQIKR